jgi:hypothetical protein
MNKSIDLRAYPKGGGRVYLVVGTYNYGDHRPGDWLTESTLDHLYLCTVSISIEIASELTSTHWSMPKEVNMDD